MRTCVRACVHARDLMRTYGNLWDQSPFYIISIFMSVLYSYFRLLFKRIKITIPDIIPWFKKYSITTLIQRLNFANFNMCKEGEYLLITTYTRGWKCTYSVLNSEDGIVEFYHVFQAKNLFISTSTMRV